jgi:hypothetical protein
MNPFPALFSPFSMRHLKFSNRIVHTPVVTGLENECLQWPRGSFNAPIEWTPAATRFPSPVNKEDE